VILRYWHTLRYLKFSQTVGRVWRKFKRIKVDHSPAGKLRSITGSWVVTAKQSQQMFGEYSFTFLNVSHDLNSASDWNNEQWDKLWLYNLHYFDDLTAVDAEKRIEWHSLLIQRWIDENSIGNGNGWEPYPSSLRIVNWIKWGVSGNKLEDKWLNSLVIQVRYLSQSLETHLLGNHLFANAKALLFAGLFFSGKEADEWYQLGKKIVEKELPEQVLADGGYFELSTMYHSIFLEDLLDIINIHHAYSQHSTEMILGFSGLTNNLVHLVKKDIAKMVRWLDTMTHPDGGIGFFNDAAVGVTPSVVEIKDYLDRISGLTELSLDKNKFVNPGNLVHPVQSVKDVLVDLPESGYSRVEMGNVVVLIDRAAVGPDYIPGHAHADTLSFEMSLFGQRVVVNSGTSVYGTGEQRQIERGTVAHSTVAVDGENSSEVWGGFRVARRAKVFDRKQSEGGGTVHLSACHDGYKRLSGKPTHFREWLLEDGMITIHDKISGKGRHEVVSVLPLHPDIKVCDIEDNQVKLDVLGNKVVVKVEGVGKLEVVTDCYHPEFGLSVENRKLIYRVDSILPIEFSTVIYWRNL
jgi:uncharacterized heparinase superfamily protein